MGTWSKAIFRIVGSVNLILAALGVWLSAGSVVRFVTAIHPRANEPYLTPAFFTITAVNWAFLVALIVTAVQFLRLRASAVVPYAITVALFVCFSLANGALWLAGGGIGMSIAGATGIGNMGTVLFELLFIVPNAYPIISAALLLATRRRLVSVSNVPLPAAPK